MTAPSGNDLIRLLPGAEAQRLLNETERVTLASGDILHDAGEPVTHTWFPCDRTLVGLLVDANSGGYVEAALVGSEGAVGAMISPGALPAFARAEMQIGGDLLRAPVSALHPAQSPLLADWMSRYGDCLLAQTLQSAACNATHSIEQRAAKWITAVAHRTGRSSLPFTQERLAGMLGVGRPFVNRVLQKYKGEGLIELRRGLIVVSDADRLAKQACQCDVRVRAHYADVMTRRYG